MKIILCLMLPALLSSQVDSALWHRLSLAEESITNLEGFKRDTEQKFNHLQLNFNQHHKIFRIGAGWHIAGIIVSTLAIPMYSNSLTAGALLSGAGGAMMLGGTITMWRSHRFIGRAGSPD